jgi:pimeloyl-ACP methyl ester carboxylesterase
MRDEEGPAREYTEMWCKDGKIGYVAVGGGGRVRYLRVGVGPPLVLMHTVRTQLDHFQFVIPRLTESFTVYALDFPGMGWSDIVPGASYDEAALRAAVVRVVEDLDLAEVTLAGESMGATLSLTASVDLGARVRRIVAFNTYDFADGAQRANLLARLVIGSIRLPGWAPSLPTWKPSRSSRAFCEVACTTPVGCPTTTSVSSVASVGAPDIQWSRGGSTATWRA